MQLPKILIISSSSEDSEAIKYLIAEHNNRSTWFINTKYYTAEAELHVKSTNDVEDLGSYEAVVLTCSARDRASLNLLQDWWASQDDSSTDCLPIKLMAAVGHESYTWFEEADNWCSERLVEFIDCTAGPARLREALQAHMWPGLVRKKEPSMLPGVEDDMDLLSVDELLSRCGDSDLLVENEDEGIDKLFERLYSAREKFSQLPDYDRREQAAHLVSQLMLAIGLDDDGDDDDGDD